MAENRIDERMQCVFVSASLEIAFRDFESGNRLLADEVQHMPERALAACTTLGADECDPIEV